MNIYQKLYRGIKDHCELEDDAIIDAGRHGADAGWGGFSYTKDCCEFYEANKEEIWELLREAADGQGLKPLELVAQFGRSDMADDPDGLENLLAWFALEEVGRWLEDNRSEGDDFEEEEESDEKD
jgi:hypothetical protein